MKKVIGVVVILLSLPLLAWSFYVEVIFLGEAKGKYNKMMTTAEERYLKSNTDAEKRYKNKKETITKKYNKKIATLDGQMKILYEKQFKKMEKSFDDTYAKAVNFRNETYQKVKTTTENAFNKRVSMEREVAYSIPSGILGLIFLVIGIFSIWSARKKATVS